MTTIKYYCHAHMPTGYGRAALDLAIALDRTTDAKLEIRTIGAIDPAAPWPVPKHLMEPIITAPDVVIVHTLPGDCHRVLELEGLRRGEGPKLIAYTTWEALTAPTDVLELLYGHFDQVWVPSQPNQAAFKWGDLRPLVIPHCFDELAPIIEGYPVTDRFRFYWVGAWSSRKNPNGLIRAFAHAFSAGSRAELVIHSPGTSMETFVHALACTGYQQQHLPKITLSNQPLSDVGIRKMHAEADCFVSATRGEAWNLPAFEAMLAGRHVITQYGLGSDDFLIDTTADLVDGVESPAQVDVAILHGDDGAITMKRVGAQGLNAGCVWLDPNLVSISEAMRHAATESKRDIKINYDVAGRFGYAAVAKQVMNVLETQC